MASPALYCPFVTRLHPAAALIHARSLSWAETMKLAEEQGARRRLEGSRIGYLVCRAWPDAEPGLLQLASDWTLLFCVLDDHIEQLDGSMVARRLRALLAVLAGQVASGEDPLAPAFADLSARLLAAAPPGWMARFLDQVAALFQAFVQESAHRSRGQGPALVAYGPLREQTVGLHPLFLMGELFDRSSGPGDRATPRLAALASGAARVVGWANDIHTCERERAEGELHNLVMVLERERGLSPEEALWAAHELHDQEVQRWLRLEAEVVSTEGSGIDGYLGQLRSWMGGHLAWATETGRYRPSPP